MRVRVLSPTNPERITILGGVAVDPAYRGKFINTPTIMEELVRRRVTHAFDNRGIDVLLTNARPGSRKNYEADP